MKILHETDVLSTEDLSSVFADLRVRQEDRPTVDST